jgi:hypothetical protein
MGHAVMEIRNGLAICGEVTHATGTAEREVVLAWLDERPPRRLITLGCDKAYEVFDFVQALKERNITPHIAINGAIGRHGIARKTAVDRRTTRHPGYAISQCIRKRIEEIFGWVKSTGGLDQLKVEGGLRLLDAAASLGWKTDVHFSGSCCGKPCRAFAARTRQDRNRAEEAAPARIHMRGMRSADGPSLERIGPSKGRFASKAALKPTSPPSRGVLLQ